MKLIEEVDYFLHYVKMPNKANPAITMPNDDGTFDIFLNTLYSQEYLVQVLEHELRHLQREHFYIEAPINELERQADGGHVNPALHPPEGKIARFYSCDALAAYVKMLAQQRGIKL